MRERGSRAFLVSGEPVGDIPPNHHTFDKVWSAATDLGMVALLHVGLSPSSYPPRLGEHRQPRADPSDLGVAAAPDRAGVPERDGVRRRLRATPEAHRPHVGTGHRLVGADGGAHGRDGVARSERPRHRRVRPPAAAERVRPSQHPALAAAGAARVTGRDARGASRGRRCSRPTTRTSRAIRTPSSTTTRNSLRSTTPSATGSSAATSPRPTRCMGDPL